MCNRHLSYFLFFRCGQIYLKTLIKHPVFSYDAYIYLKIVLVQIAVLHRFSHVKHPHLFCPKRKNPHFLRVLNKVIKYKVNDLIRQIALDGPFGKIQAKGCSLVW